MEWRGKAQLKVQTAGKPEKVTLNVLPESRTGYADSTEFTLSVTKDLTEPISCRFFQQLDGEDVRLDDLSSSSDKEQLDGVFSTDPETIVTKLTHAKNDSSSQMVKVIAFCTNEKGSDRLISTVDIFLKPSPTDVKNVKYVENSAPVEALIDPTGMQVFGKGLNDRQKVTLFADMFDQIQSEIA